MATSFKTIIFLLFFTNLLVAQSGWDMGIDLGFSYARLNASYELDDFFTRNTGTLSTLHFLNKPDRGVASLSPSVAFTRLFRNNLGVGLSFQKNTFGLRSKLNVVNLQVGQNLQWEYKNIYKLKSYELKLVFKKHYHRLSYGLSPAIDIYQYAAYSNFFKSPSSGEILLSRVSAVIPISEKFSLRGLKRGIERRTFRFGGVACIQFDIPVKHGFIFRLGLSGGFYSPLIVKDPKITSFLSDSTAMFLRLYTGIGFTTYKESEKVEGKRKRRKKKRRLLLL